ncbi:MAG TPA: NnrS family protein [Sedimenticola sp.]|nr:NnrS family protein [Sedimenticola sp.]
MKDIFFNLSSKPHKLYFLGGISSAIIYMVLILAHYLGNASPEVALPVHHAYAMMFVLFTQFFTAFVFTMFPRFLSTDPVPAARYIPIFLLLNVSSIAFAVSLYLTKSGVIVAMLGGLAAYGMICKVLLEINSKSSMLNRYDTNWVLLAFGMGGISYVLFIVSLLGAGDYHVSRFAINIGFFLYVFMVVLTLSQKMIPFFTEGKIAGYKSNKSRLFLEAVFGLLVIKVLLASMQLAEYAFVVDFCLAVITLGEIVKWKLPFFKAEAILWVLYLSLLWIPVGFFLFFLEGLTRFLSDGAAVYFEKSPLHAIALGYFTTIAVGFGSRIILGHAGQKPKADAFTIGLFWLIQLLVVVRVAGGLSLNVDASLFAGLIITSAALWLVLFVLWSKRYVRLLFEP